METLSNSVLTTGLLGKLSLDQPKLNDALVAIDAMPTNDAYSAFNLTVDPRKPGAWAQIVLGNWSGDANDGRSVEYDGRFQWTAEGEKVPFIRDLVESNFRCEYLKSVRVFSAENAIIVSHRDYMEFKKGFRRLHIPLRTNERCMNSEADLVYHMNVGNIYFVDGREAHAGGNFASGEPRVHLVLDFDPDIPVPDLFIAPERDLTWGSIDWLPRPILNDADIGKIIDGFAALLSQETYPALVLAANMLPFAFQFDTSAVYDVIVEAATRTGKPGIAGRARRDRQHFLGRAAERLKPTGRVQTQKVTLNRETLPAVEP